VFSFSTDYHLHLLIGIVVTQVNATWIFLHSSRSAVPDCMILL